MSGYFDNLNRSVREAASNESKEEFMFSVIAIEAQLYREVTAITGDREFPEDLREKIMGAFATSSTYQPGRLPVPERARDYAIATSSSKVIEEIHDLFHELARRRVKTRFGVLNDSPTGIKILRDEHDDGS